MGVDLRQVVAGVLTLTMFVMLGNMIKRDHFDSVEGKFPGARDVEFDSEKVSERGLVTFSKKNTNGPWMEGGLEPKPCWKESNFDEVESKGFVTFSLTNGPEYHVSQIADAVVVARYIGATLVLPDIRGSKPGDERKFEEIYDVEKFVKSLVGVVKVVKGLPKDVSIRDFAVVKVPNRVSEDHIAEQIEPVFRTNRIIRLATFFPSVNMRKTTKTSASDSVACLAMFGTLELQPVVNEVAENPLLFFPSSSLHSSSISGLCNHESPCHHYHEKLLSLLLSYADTSTATLPHLYNSHLISPGSTIYYKPQPPPCL